MGRPSTSDTPTGHRPMSCAGPTAAARNFLPGTRRVRPTPPRPASSGPCPDVKTRRFTAGGWRPPRALAATLAPSVAQRRAAARSSIQGIAPASRAHFAGWSTATLIDPAGRDGSTNHGPAPPTQITAVRRTGCARRTPISRRPGAHRPGPRPIRRPDSVSPTAALRPSRACTGATTNAARPRESETSRRSRAPAPAPPAAPRRFPATRSARCDCRGPASS
jgi:hypothetical protein